ncbi:HET-domain-containing protein [Setomelanomma holmii]|uniref:HET-domain-containing protein n=1 Tax=Setomelanomma holmii TaxID=210430 RepID=A0A9P4LMB5_9PLEO|nr:HET-domain-containing protein [Setomelanomma holmii]
MDAHEQTSTESFVRRPLDHSKAAVRLVQLLPNLSPAGLIQCVLMHATVDAKYLCLSYRWGDPEPSGVILIDSKVFGVRQNLLDFLQMARANGQASIMYWIDALCIDQSNAAERAHQVAQMGDIFSQALGVYLWLGANPKLAPVLQAFYDPEAATPQQWGLIGANRKALEAYICGNEYWQRAWIIQEIFLAKIVTVWANNMPLLFEHLH